MCGGGAEGARGTRGRRALDIHRFAAELLRAGETFCLATVVASTDPAVPAGRKALVRRDGALEGSLGSPDLDGALVARAAGALRRRHRATADLRPGVTAFLDVLEGEARLLVCGAGHIALSLARFAREVGFGVTVLDDRPDFASRARFPNCEVLCEDFSGALSGLPLGPAWYVVVVTRGHAHDTECLAEILPRETAYVGLIGSRRRVRFVKDDLARAGVPAERLDDLFTPIGLPLGGEAPEEIALAIAAELVAVRRLGADAARTLRGREEGEP